VAERRRRLPGRPAATPTLGALATVRPGRCDGDGERTGGGNRRRARRSLHGSNATGRRGRDDDGTRGRGTDRGAGRGGRGVHPGSRRSVRRCGESSSQSCSRGKQRDGGGSRARTSGCSSGPRVRPFTLARGAGAYGGIQRQTGGHGVRIKPSTWPATARSARPPRGVHSGVAQRVVETGRDHALEPMSSLDRQGRPRRRAEFDGVETISEGEEPRRAWSSADLGRRRPPLRRRAG